MNSQQQLFLNTFPKGYEGYAIDVGANDGIFLSNTDILEQRGWQVLCVEGNPLYAPALWRNRKQTLSCAVGAVAGRLPFYVYETSNNEFAAKSGLDPKAGDKAIMVIPVAVETLDAILGSWKPPQLDLLTIDVEGGEEAVLKGFDIAKWKPKVICIEDIQCSQHFRAILEPFGYHFVDCFNDDEVYSL